MTKLYRARQWLLLIIMLSSPWLQAESILEYHQRQCAAGNESSCERASVMEEADRQAKRIETLGGEFAGRIDREKYETENKPELELAYLDVMADYFNAEKASGIKNTMGEQMLAICAGHFHDHWRNRKMVWPTDTEQRPDWSAIYYYIVDHYYGYCVRNYMGGFSNS